MTNHLQLRVTYCLLMAVADASVLFLPKLIGGPFWLLVSVGLALNACALFLITRGVKPLDDDGEYTRVIVASRRWITIIVISLTLVALAFAFSGTLYKQVIPFLLLAYFFLTVIPGRVFDVALDKRISELGNR